MHNCESVDRRELIDSCVTVGLAGDMVVKRVRLQVTPVQRSPDIILNRIAFALHQWTKSLTNLET